MPLPLLAAAAISAIPGIIKTIAGGKQKREANKMKRSNYIPPSIDQGLDRARVMASSNTLPGQQRIEENIRQSGAGALEAAGIGSASDKISAANAISGQETQSFENLGEQAAQMKLQNEQIMQGILGKKAGFEYQNEQDFQNKKTEMLNSASQNIFGGLSDVGSVATSFLAPKTMMPNFKKMTSEQISKGIQDGILDPSQLDAATLNRLLMGK